MVRRLLIWHWRLKQQWLNIEMENSIIMERETRTEPIGISSICNINLHDYPKTETWLTHISIHRKFHYNWLDSQGIL